MDTYFFIELRNLFFIIFDPFAHFYVFFEYFLNVIIFILGFVLFLVYFSDEAIFFGLLSVIVEAD